MNPVRLTAFILALYCLSALSACGQAGTPPRNGDSNVVTRQRTTVRVVAMQLTSEAFLKGEMIPREYTCDGANISPALSWDPGSIQNIKSYALICDDPDAPAGTWVHWVILSMPDSVRSLPKGIGTAAGMSGMRQGQSDFRKNEYGGPCPPGGTHRYFFRIYALDTILAFPEGAHVSKATLVKAMAGHIIGMGELMGKYGR